MIEQPALVFVAQTRERYRPLPTEQISGRHEYSLVVLVRPPSALTLLKQALAKVDDPAYYSGVCEAPDAKIAHGKYRVLETRRAKNQILRIRFTHRYSHDIAEELMNLGVNSPQAQKDERVRRALQPGSLKLVKAVENRFDPPPTQEPETEPKLRWYDQLILQKAIPKSKQLDSDSPK